MARNKPAVAETLKVESLSHEGRGIAHRDGKVCFVSGALAGETVTAVTRRRRRRFDELEVVEVLQPAATRVPPPCEYASRCGGCSLQHFAVDAQLTFKQEALFEQLRRELGAATDQVEPLPPVAGARLGYRRRARLGVRFLASKGGALVGFRERHSHFITDMTSCSVLAPPAAALIEPLRVLVGGLDAARQLPQIEVAVGEEDADGGGQRLRVALVLRHLRSLSEVDLGALAEFGESHDCHIYLQDGKPDAVRKLYPEGGEERLSYRLPNHELRLGFHPMDFVQVNAEVNSVMVDRVVETLAVAAGDRVLDLFCGLGNFSLPLARRAAAVVGVEGEKGLVARARENAQRNGLDNVEFHQANLFSASLHDRWHTMPCDKVLIDPPRSGAIEVLPRVAALAPQVIVYVSCNPATLARDSAALAALGYPLRAAGVMDMFPHTAHVESMAVFRNQEDSS